MTVLFFNFEHIVGRQNFEPRNECMNCTDLYWLKFIAWVDPHSQFCYKGTKTLPCFKNKKNCSFPAKKDQTMSL